MTITQFIHIGRAEGISYLLLLFIAMPLKYAFDIPEAVKYTGWAHGLLFIAYLIAIAWMGHKRSWSFLKMFLFVLAALLPFGPFVAEAKLLSREAKEERAS